MKLLHSKIHQTQILGYEFKIIRLLLFLVDFQRILENERLLAQIEKNSLKYERFQRFYSLLGESASGSARQKILS